MSQIRAKVILFPKIELRTIRLPYPCTRTLLELKWKQWWDWCQQAQGNSPPCHRLQDDDRGGEAEASTRRWWWWGRGGVFGWLRGGGWRGRGGWVGSPGEGTRILFDDFCLQVARVATTVDNSLEDISPKQFAEYPGTWSCQKEWPPVVYQGSPNSWPIGQYIAFFYKLRNKQWHKTSR